MVDVSSVISLEDMKEIMNKSVENSETWKDFYTGIIIGVYKLGLERGKITSSSKLGNWIKNGKYNYTYKCSVCGEIGPLEPVGEGVFKFNFCPNCGADMRGEQYE